MSLSHSTDGLSAELHSTYDMVRAAFPAGIPDENYRAALLLLAENMSQRQLARLMAYCTGRDYYRVYNDVLAVLSGQPAYQPPDEQVAEVRRRLQQHGYDHWLTEE